MNKPLSGKPGRFTEPRNRKPLLSSIIYDDGHYKFKQLGIGPQQPSRKILLIRKLIREATGEKTKRSSNVNGIRDAPFEGKATNVWDGRYESGDLMSARVADDTDPIDYTGHDFLHRHFVAKPMTGVASHKSREFLMRSVFGLVSPDKVLAVGSGLAHEEQSLIAANIVRKIDAYELSEVAVKSARERIAKAGFSERLTMNVGDVTKAGLANNSYDAIFVSAAIHHFFNIEEMMDFFYAVLKPGGILVYNEYVGPDHHMYHTKVMEYINRINECLDEKLRYDNLQKEVRSFVSPATLEWMLEMDPSEGVHASLILPLTYQKFDVVQRFDYGGTIMRPFWVGILNNFDFSNPKDQTIARLIGLIEELLLDTREIPTYHTLVAARKGEQDPTKPLIDNEILSYKNHGYETEKLEPSIFRKEKVLCCVNLTDENWQNGVLKSGPLRLLLPSSPPVKKALDGGKCLVVADGRSVAITKVEETSSSFVVHCENEALDRAEFAAPSHFWVSDV